MLRSRSEPSLAALPGGLPGTERPRALRIAADLWAIAGGAPLADYSAAAIERGLSDLAWVTARATAHERVVESAMKLGAVLPLKLFTLFRDDARAAADLGRRRRVIARALDRVEGCIEWGVRVRIDADLAQRRIRERAEADTGAATDGAGARFLARKKREKDAVAEVGRRALAAADDAFDQLSAHARDAVRRPPTEAELGARLVLDAAFLVEREAADRFDAAARAAADAVAAEGGELVLTGPWPPYNFVGGAR